MLKSLDCCCCCCCCCWWKTGLLRCYWWLGKSVWSVCAGTSERDQIISGFNWLPTKPECSTNWNSCTAIPKIKKMLGFFGIPHIEASQASSHKVNLAKQALPRETASSDQTIQISNTHLMRTPRGLTEFYPSVTAGFIAEMGYLLGSYVPDFGQETFL